MSGACAVLPAAAIQTLLIHAAHAGIPNRSTNDCVHIYIYHKQQGLPAWHTIRKSHEINHGQKR